MKKIPYITIRADENPQVIFKKCEDAMAEYRAEINKPILPKCDKIEVKRNKVGWQNFVNLVMQLKP